MQANDFPYEVLDSVDSFIILYILLGTYGKTL